MILAFLFFTPAFAVAGLCLAGIPVVIHLLNRRRYKVVDWAAMEFLLRAMRKNRKRVRFEQWLLLACRCLLLALLGVALARPVGCEQAGSSAIAGRTGMHVFVIDTGLSMSYQPGRPGGLSHLEQAKQIANAVIDKLAHGGESVVVITAGHPAAAVIALPTSDLTEAKAVINRIPQTYGTTDLAEALRLAESVARKEDRQPNKRLYLFTDAAASEWQPPDAAAIASAGVGLAKLYQVEHFNLAIGPQWDQAVTDLRPTESLVTNRPDFGSAFVADVRGFGAPHPATLQWKMDGKILGGGGPVSPDGATKSQTEPETELQSAWGNGGPHRVTAALVGDDKLPADNARDRVVNVVSSLKVLVVEGRGGAGQNLAAALRGQTTAGAADGFAAPDLISDLDLGNRPLADYRAVVMCGVPSVTTAQADQLAKFARDGGTVQWFLDENASPENYNGTLLPRGLIPGKLIKQVSAVQDRAYRFDFQPNTQIHPLLRALDKPNTGLETAQTFGYWQADVPIDPAVRVLNFLPPDGTPVDKTVKPDPAITLTSLGSGRVLFCATSAAEPWITWTRKPIYIPLINELLAGTVDTGDGWLNLTVGDRLTVPPTSRLTGVPGLIDPKSAAIALERFTLPDGAIAWRSPPLVLPGVYTLATGPGAEMPVAVNVPAAASDVHTIDNSAIKAALGNIDVTLNGDQPPAVVDPTRAGSDQGWNVMALVLLLAGFEAFLAMRFGHFRKATAVAATA